MTTGNIKFAVSEPLVSNPDWNYRDRPRQIPSGQARNTEWWSWYCDASGISFRTSFGGLSASCRRRL